MTASSPAARTGRAPVPRPVLRAAAAWSALHLALAALWLLAPSTRPGLEGSAVLAETGARDRTQAVVLAYRSGFVR